MSGVTPTNPLGDAEAKDAGGHAAHHFGCAFCTFWQLRLFGTVFAMARLQEIRASDLQTLRVK
jgi:hypothetical protein